MEQEHSRNSDGPAYRCACHHGSEREAEVTDPDETQSSFGPNPVPDQAAEFVELENGDGLRLTPPFTGCPLTAARAPGSL
jgi:hypothetical protein